MRKDRATFSLIRVMFIQVLRFSVIQQLAQGHRPAVLVRLDQGDKGQRVEGLATARLGNNEMWGILRSKLLAEPVWSWNKSGDQIVIPMFEYLVPDASPESMVHFGAQTGALAISQAVKFDPIKVLVCLGDVLKRPDGKSGFQAWAGYAACVPQK